MAQYNNSQLPIANFTTFAMTTFAAQFPGTTLPFDDDFLIAEGYARLDQPWDYSVNPASQILASQSPTYDSGAKLVRRYVVETTTLIAAQQYALAQLNALYNTKINAGFNYSGNNYAIQQANLLNMVAIDVQFLRNFFSSYPGYYTTATGAQVTFSTTDLITFFNAVYAYVAALDVNFDTLLGTIMLQTTVVAVVSIDITQGWPSN